MNLSAPLPADVTDSSSTDSFHIDPTTRVARSITHQASCEIIKKLENEKGRTVIKTKAMQFMMEKEYIRLRSRSQIYKIFKEHLPVVASHG